MRLLRDFPSAYLLSIGYSVNLYSIFNSVGYTGGVPASGFAVNTWHQVTATYTSGSTAIYMDGSATPKWTTDYYTGSIPSSSDTLELGGWSGGTSHNFMGLLDDIGIWGQQLTAGEAAAMCTTPKSFGLGATNQYGAGTMQNLFATYTNQDSVTGTTVGARNGSTTRRSASEAKVSVLPGATLRVTISTSAPAPVGPTDSRRRFRSRVRWRCWRRA